MKNKLKTKILEFLERLFKRKYVLKIFALLAAAVLWFFVIQEQNPQINMRYTIPIQVPKVSEKTSLHLNEEYVKVKLRARRSVFINLVPEDLSATVDTDALEEGVQTLKVDVDVPKGIEILTITPETVEADFETSIEMQKRVALFTAGHLPENFTILNVFPYQESGTVSGFRRSLESVQSLTGYINLAEVNPNENNLYKTFHVKLVPMTVHHQPVNRVEAHPKEIFVRTRLAKNLPKKTVAVRPTFKNNLPDGYVVKSTVVVPDKIDLVEYMATTSNSRLNQIESIATEPIDLSQIRQNTTQTIFLESLPDRIFLAQPAQSTDESQTAQLFLDEQKLNRTVQVQITIEKK